MPNKEIANWGWFTIEEAFRLPLMKETKGLLEKYVEYTKYRDMVGGKTI